MFLWGEGRVSIVVFPASSTCAAPPPPPSPPTLVQGDRLSVSYCWVGTWRSRLLKVIVEKALLELNDIRKILGDVECQCVATPICSGCANTSPLPLPVRLREPTYEALLEQMLRRWKKFYIRGRSRGIEGFSSLASRERPTAYPLLLSLHCPASISAEQRWCKTYCQNPFGRFQRFCRDGGGRPEEAQGWRGQGKRNREAGERIGRAQHPRRKKVVLQCAPHNTHKNPQCATPSPPQTHPVPPPPNPPHQHPMAPPPPPPSRPHVSNSRTGKAVNTSILLNIVSHSRVGQFNSFKQRKQGTYSI